ncbi:MAG: DinB family protein [Ginsengibacter sp.]
MYIKDHLIEAFKFNDVANKKLLVKIKALDDTEGSVRLFSHLINTQKKWMMAIMQDPSYKNRNWWDPVYCLERLEEEWDGSTAFWLNYISGKTDEELLTESVRVDFEGSLWVAILKDIILQLNYHSIHHRAQIQVMIRQQGIEPDFLDYIGTKVRKMS